MAVNNQEQLVLYKLSDPECKEEDVYNGLKMLMYTGQTRAYSKAVRKYIEKHNRLLESFIDTLDILGDQSPSSVLSERREERKMKIIYFIILAGNLMLLLAKVIAVSVTRSFALLATLLDSMIDSISAIVFYLVSLRIRQKKPHVYPVGQIRLECVVVIIFAVFMVACSFQVITESIRKIQHLAANADEPTLFSRLALGLMCICVLMKIFCFFLCHCAGSGLSNKALKLDQGNDIITLSTAIFFYVMSARFPQVISLRYFDAVGAILLSAYIIIVWIAHIIPRVQGLVGKSASPQFLQKITFVCLMHSSHILALETVQAYSFGKRYFVEVNIVLPATTEFQVAHDIGVTLQTTLEKLPEVERAFVHCEFEADHPVGSEHQPKA